MNSSLVHRVTPASSPIWTGPETVSTSSPTQETTRSSSVGLTACLSSHTCKAYPFFPWTIKNWIRFCLFSQGRHPVVNTWPTWTRCATWSGPLTPALWASTPLVGWENSLFFRDLLIWTLWAHLRSTDQLLPNRRSHWLDYLRRISPITSRSQQPTTRADDRE